MKTALIIGGCFLLGALTAGVILPLVDRELMRTPMIEALAAVRAGKPERLQACFTSTATLAAGDAELAVSEALDRLAPLLVDGHGADLRFGGYGALRSAGAGITAAEFTVWIYVEDPVGRRLPLRKHGAAHLVRTGWFRWQLHRLASDEPEFAQALKGIAALPRGE